MSADTAPDWTWHEAQGLSRIVNVSGTMTGLGASVTRPEVAEATAAAMARFARIHEMQLAASGTIARLTGAEAGFLTASASAGITLAIAGCMTGLSPARVEALPRDPGLRNAVAVQLGHLCDYGAPLSQSIELAGARVRPLGQSTQATDYQLEAACDEGCAAALYVVSHHVVHYGQIPFERFVAIAHERGVPVIVDAASEYDLTSFIARGADIAIYSGHKFLGGPTSGIVAGRKDLVRAGYMQNAGIGRGMKIGKESIAGAMAAMELWMTRDHAAVRAEEEAALEMWQTALEPLAGITPHRIPDPTGNPLSRLQVNVDAGLAGCTAAGFAAALGRRDPSIVVRAHEVELGYFQLDPCNLRPGQAALVRDALVEVLSEGAAIETSPEDLASARQGGIEGYLAWNA
ncbi:aminotransferase class V-fold PLP-dependent enzyme [Pseudoroseicyclus aestuarii]|uniref:L-seryl-tRNA(Sec) selenium transferase n=1 Tax=Pseudoroseicyclus aestuarii TaxID=1795041 RepID=A0A318SMN2_9RHOB|nr:aminotransferase class V-fold PLP-dependent enzyme [Pseudoroseicyclus aestuarii]PYE81193.1 L-seryl-tRNA(Sec) selenium transferase [Pseudoroseicyclus aestuarii]